MLVLNQPSQSFSQARGDEVRCISQKDGCALSRLFITPFTLSPLGQSAAESGISRSYYHAIDDLCCLSDRCCLETHIRHAFHHLSYGNVAADEFVEIESNYRNGSLGHRVGGLEDSILSSSRRGHGYEDESV
jgi:hypothetical protein